MHGRQKVARSAEDEAKKQKERDKKVAAYQHAMKIIFDKRAKGELDEEILMVTSQVLASNPDITTLWSIRKETLKKLRAADEAHFKEKLLTKELDFTQFCLKSNPKSYGAWHHRCWLTKETQFERVEEELRLCSTYLEYDDRNFHTWNYRRFLLDNCSLVTVEQELDFTIEKISSNFSNFSSWHLRSKLLPRLTRDYLSDELELIRNAVFTDPKDQSAWLYHLWLLKSQIKKESPKVVFMQLTEMDLIISFNIGVQNPSLLGLKVNIGEEVDVGWSNPWSGSTSKMWTVNFTDLQKALLSKHKVLKLTNSENCDKPLSIEVGGRGTFPMYFDDDTKPKAPEFEKLLLEELNWVIELHELEPEIKWPAVTALTLMRLINFVEYKPQIMELLDKLKLLDPKRTNYYNDQRSKYVIEWTLINHPVDSTEINLNALNLTAMYYPERLCYMKKIDCSKNQLKNCASVSGLLHCEDLNLSDNCIKSVPEFVKAVSGLPRLKTLRLSGNPLCQLHNEFDQLRELSSVDVVTSS